MRPLAGGNRRRSPRASVILPASVVTMSAYQYFDLVNLSATGAKLRGSTLPTIGKIALFRLDGFQVLCTVMWTADDLCGVKFHELIPPGVLKHFYAMGRPTLEMLTPDEEQACQRAVSTSS